MPIRFEIYKHELVDVIVYALILIITVVFAIGLDYNTSNGLVIFSFMLIGIISYVSLIQTDLCFSIYNGFHIFTYIFFFMAAIQQYTQGVVMWSETGLDVSYSDADYIYANVLIIFMQMLFNKTYKKAYVNHPHKNCSSSNNESKRAVELTDGKLYILLFVCISSFLILAISNNITSETVIIKDTNINAQVLNIMKYFPVCIFLIYMGIIQAEKRAIQWWFIIPVTLEILVIFFPTWGVMARFFLLGTYIVIMSFFLCEYKHKSLCFAILYVGFCFAFSNMKMMTSLNDILNSTMDFIHVDFDAYQQFLLSIHYVKEYGVFWGLNILSAFAFIVPRALWKGKMLGTGYILVTTYGSWQRNVSMPLIGEAYCALSLPGVLIISVAFGRIAGRIDSWHNSDDSFKRGIFCLISGMIIYILRGSLLATLAFVLGLVLCMILINFLFLYVK